MGRHFRSFFPAFLRKEKPGGGRVALVRAGGAGLPALGSLAYGGQPASLKSLVIAGSAGLPALGSLAYGGQSAKTLGRARVADEDCDFAEIRRRWNPSARRKA